MKNCITVCPKIGVALLLGFALATAVSCRAVPGDQTPQSLRCENLVDPEGIDATVPRLSWSFAPESNPVRGQKQTAYQILVAGDPATLAAGRGDLWDSGRVESDTPFGIAYAGRPLASHRPCFWKVRIWDLDRRASTWSAPARWSMGILTPGEWTGTWIRAAGELDGAPGPLFRKTFDVRGGLKRAVISICGLGYYELRLNGAKVGDRVLDPLFTRYDKRAVYATYDVGDRLRPGRNALGVMLGKGFYNVDFRDEWDFDKAPWRGTPTLLCQLRLEYADGSVETAASDATWRTIDGPVRRDGIRNGEGYDARFEKPGWDTADFDDSGWQAAVAGGGPKGVLRAGMAPPIRVMATIRPLGITEPKPGLFVFDLGQNMAGWARLHVSGPAGSKIVLRYGERLVADGTVDQKEIAKFVRGVPFQTDSYTLKGGGEEVWEPRFAYHGFRWVEAAGFPCRPTLESLDGRVVHTSFEPAGDFASSDDLLNAIQQMTLWSYRSNFVGIPTDCPHREKNGWTGDAHLAAEQAMFNWRNTAAYESWLRDFKDEQRPDGDYAGIIPTSGWGYGIGPAWDSAYLLIPWYLYVYTGDTRPIEEHYDAWKRYLDYLGRQAKGLIVDVGLGDWVPAKTVTPTAITSTGYYYGDAVLMSRFAALLGKADDARVYAGLAEDIRRAFQAAFIKDDGSVGNDSQTALSCALFQDLAAPARREAIFAKLVQNVLDQDGHLDVGILGAKYLFRVLADNGRTDLALRVVRQTTPPSYGDWLKRGATTLWEDWGDGSSRNHVMFGDISAWFYQYLAGINADPEKPAFRHIILRPNPAGALTFAKAWHESPFGRIESEWTIAGGLFRWRILVPPGATATVYVPAADPDAVKEGRLPAARSEAVRFIRREKDAAVFEVSSGRYEFSCPFSAAGAR
ncbi:MAG: glycoside hydrolase family 78 protein [Acidobacteriota bacterium]|nr:glycoside hydrolase family 78 protein [Acidobacteriota bacterium]